MTAGVVIVVQPHHAHRLERHEWYEQSSYQGDETAKDGNGRGYDIGDDGDGGYGTEPGDPVGWGGGGQVFGVSQDPHKEEFCGELFVSLTASRAADR